MVFNLDLLLINVGGARKRIYQSLSKDYSAIEPPFWAALTADFIRRKGFEVRILDANAENLDMKETTEKINECNPKLTNIVAYGQNPSASTALMPSVGILCKQIKEENPELKTILTGLHPSALPKRTLEEEACDFVGEGEGFQTLQGLLENRELQKIPGLWYRQNGEIFSNARAENIKELASELPGIAWDLLPMDQYRAHNWHCFGDLESRKNYASISTSLGCPFSCSFCCINAPFGKPAHRTWNPEWALKQIDTLVREYNVKNIKFIDELFIMNPKEFLPIINGLIERDYNLNIWAYARVDTIKEKYLDRLKQAGVNWLGIGIESGDEEIRQDMEKGKFHQADIKSVVKKINEHGIGIGANYIFGLPDDTLESMQRTLDLATNLNCEWGNFYCAMAYPGSQLYRDAKKQGLFLPEDDGGPGWIGYSQHSYETLPLPTKTLSSAEILKFRDNAFDKYFTNPKYLDMVRKKFGLETKEHIKEMTKTKLKRKILGD